MNKKIIKLAVVVPALLGALVIASVLTFNAVRHVIIEDNETLVHSVAQSILPALLVNDTQQVDALMKALESYPGIESAELISSQGASIASYARSGHSLDAMSTSFELASANEDPNAVHVMAPITFDSVIVANLHIAVNLWPAYLRIVTWLGVLLIVPSVIYILIKQFRIKVRIEKANDWDRSGGGGNSFNVSDAVNQAMKEAEISLEFQPIQRMSDSGLFGMEVQICWAHPSGQTLHISSSEFISLAEKSGICLPFDDWLLTNALIQGAAWQHQHGPLILTLNISASQFSNPEFAQKVRLACEQAQYPHQLLELEVNESVVLRFAENASTYVSAFAEQGLGVTIDNFGLSLSSSEILNVLPVNKIKIDRKLIKRMSYDEAVRQSILATVDQALLHDVQVMADGIETADQHIELQLMGCILGQGSYFHAPMSVSSFKGFLASRPFDKLSKRLARNQFVDKQGFSAA
jgi:EAL domain-containing protein (putative c-di-GMP-specific phosphodiesterase class I)